MKANKKRTIICAVFFLLLSVLSYEFLFGKLFPFSPVLIEFTRHNLNNTIIYVEKGAEFKDFVRIDTLVPEVEKNHELKFLYKPKIFVFNDSLGFIRRSYIPTRLVTYFNRIFISPWALHESYESKISLEIYLRHELSHALINQNSGFLNSLKFPVWLKEGIAVYSANQMGTSFYPCKDETYKLISQGNFMPPKYFRTRKEKEIKIDLENRVAFLYSEFACIVDYLIVRNGKDKFFDYIGLLNNGMKSDKAFRIIYNQDFTGFISDFRSYIKECENTTPK